MSLYFWGSQNTESKGVQRKDYLGYEPLSGTLDNPRVQADTRQLNICPGGLCVCKCGPM
jgi:hypothetical protein